MPGIDVLQTLPKEPGIGGSMDREFGNQEHHKQIIDLNEVKKNLKSQLGYGDYIQNPLDNTIDAYTPEQDSIYQPLIENLKNSGEIPKDVYNLLMTQISQAESDDQQKKILRDVISDLPDGEIKNNLSDFLSGKNEQIDEDNFEESQLYRDVQGTEFKMDVGVGGLEIMLAKNYVSLPDKNGNADVQQDIFTTMNIAVNQILKSNSASFKEQNTTLIREIRSENNIEKKYTQLKELYKNDLKEDAQFGGKKSLAEITRKQKMLKQQAEKITEELMIARQKNTYDEYIDDIKKLTKQREQIIAEAQELDIFEGEVFGGGELDTTSESLTA